MHVLQEIRKNLTSRLGKPATHRLNEYEQAAVGTVYHTLDGKQKEVLNSTGWLLYGARGSGRSWVMACASIINAINNPNMTFRIYDHISNERIVVDYTFNMVERIIRELPWQVGSKLLIMRKPVHSIEYVLRKE